MPVRAWTLKHLDDTGGEVRTTLTEGHRQGVNRARARGRIGSPFLHVGCLRRWLRRPVWAAIKRTGLRRDSWCNKVPQVLQVPQCGSYEESCCDLPRVFRVAGMLVLHDLRSIRRAPFEQAGAFEGKILRTKGLLMIPNLVDSATVAIALDCSAESVRRAARTGDGILGIQPVRVPGGYRWDLDALTEAMRVKP